jgi:hypothetical protein
LAGFGEIWRNLLARINEINGLRLTIWRLAPKPGFSGLEGALKALKSLAPGPSWGARAAKFVT